MTLKVSVGARNENLGLNDATKIGMQATTISFDSASKEIRDSGNGFVTTGFWAGEELLVIGSPANSGLLNIVSVAAGVIVVEEELTDEAAGATIALVTARGGSWRDILKNGIIEIRSGAQPTNPSDADTGTLLGTVTLNSGAFVAGAEGNGLEFGDASDGELAKASSETWSFQAVASGTAGHFRFKGNATDAGGASTTLPRIDGSIGTSGADLNMSSTSITSGSTYTIDAFKFTLPQYYGA